MQHFEIAMQVIRISTKNYKLNVFTSHFQPIMSRRIRIEPSRAFSVWCRWRSRAMKSDLTRDRRPGGLTAFGIVLSASARFVARHDGSAHAPHWILNSRADERISNICIFYFILTLSITLHLSIFLHAWISKWLRRQHTATINVRMFHNV